ncbi:hypothetical protein DSL92_05150 [Billgrantia gudaonensis]|uniref:Uncharacterized protein n=1 Tax=Billgrantia gudaonensis TaxID=376427 RepID=A0A432JJU4_9GAMM|nr:hypothetical protein DSL92_05150 [Halomonas gudaonensis]
MDLLVRGAGVDLPRDAFRFHALPLDDEGRAPPRFAGQGLCVITGVGSTSNAPVKETLCSWRGSFACLSSTSRSSSVRRTSIGAGATLYRGRRLSGVSQAAPHRQIAAELERFRNAW